MSKQETAAKADKKSSAGSSTETVLSEAKRNGQTVRVVTDGKRVWKEAPADSGAGPLA